MNLKEIILNQDTCDKIGQLDETIRLRSVEIGTVLLRLRALETQLQGLYESRQSSLNQIITAENYDLKRVHSVTIMPNEADANTAKLGFMYRDE